MSLFRSTLRPPAVLSDDAVERYVAALRTHVDPDPAFRRRLRGVVLNQYVATREGGLSGVVPRTMGRLGRAVLYASFVLGVSVTGVMAASEAAVPGDVLYPLKRAIEEMRVEVLPAQFRDELAVYELNERLSELALLAERGEDERAIALAIEVADEYASVLVEAVADGEQLDRRTEVLAMLIAQLPAEARSAIDLAIGAPTGTNGAIDPVDGTTSRGDQSGSAGDAGASDGFGSDDGRADGAESGAGQGDGGDTAQGEGSASRAGEGGSAGQGSQDGDADDLVEDAGGDSVDPSPTPEPSPTPKAKKQIKP